MQTMLMAPKGLLGFLYSSGLYPFHWLILRNLIRAIIERAEARQVQDALAALAA